MKLTKGMFMDSTEQDTPPGAYRFAKNIVDTNTVGSKENEDGFYEIGTLAPYDVIGIIPVEENFVVFSTNNTDSEIGLVTRVTEAIYNYSTIYSNTALDFSTLSPVKGEFKREDGDRIIAWTDKINPPRKLNIDDVASISNINDLSLFPDIINPSVNFVVNNSGGALLSGSIIPITKYIDDSGAETSWYVHDKVISIIDDSTALAYDQVDGIVGGEVTAKSVTLSFTGCDTRFTTLVIGHIKSINQQITVVKDREVPNASSVTVTLSGNETTEDLSVDEVLTPPANFLTAKAITQLSGDLYLANLTASSIPEFQPYANGIKINYGSVPSTIKTAAFKPNGFSTFLPGEVYAFYIGLALKQGGWAFYHIPGRPGLADGELDVITSMNLTFRRYQVENTTNKGAATTNMGYWENINELYPNDPSFNGTGVGNPDLRGLGVRHHRMPTLEYLMHTAHAADTSVGVSKLPILFVTVTGVNIPAEIQSQITGWKIFHAKKTNSDTLFLGSDIAQFGAEPEMSSATRWSSGGNWTVSTAPSNWEEFTALPFDTLRGHCLDMLFNPTPAVPQYAWFDAKIRKDDLNVVFTGFGSSGGLLTTEGTGRGDNNSVVIDFTLGTRSGTAFSKGLENFHWVPPQAVDGKFKTAFTEGVFVSDIFSPGSSFNSIDPTVVATTHPSFSVHDEMFVAPDDWEDVMTMQYFRILDDVHVSFMLQDLVATQSNLAAPAATTMLCNGSDGYACFLSFLTAAPNNSNPEGTTDSIIQGARCWKSYVGYSRYNFNLRHQLPGQLGSYYYGKTDPRTMFTPHVVNNLSFHTPVFTLNDGVNVVEYNEDFNRINDFSVGVIWDPDDEQETAFPNDIIVSPSWSTFLAEDRTTVGESRGEIFNIQGIRNRELFINTKYSCFRTRTDAQQQTDGETIFLKSANVFDLPPEELVTSSNGYAGCQNALGSKLTKAGYAFVDDLQGKVFLYTGALEEISTSGMRQFFRDFMKMGAVNQDNPFNLNGYNIEYEEKYNRLLVSKIHFAGEDSFHWTISYNPVTKTWISFHDYHPHYMFSTAAGRTFSVRDEKFFLMNPASSLATEKGVYFDPTPLSSFIDVPFNAVGNPADDKEFTSLSWISEVYPNTFLNGQPNLNLDYAVTCSHITMRTLQHCTGRIATNLFNDVDGLYGSNIRNINRTWYFHEIRDLAIATGITLGFYDSFNVDPSKLDSNMEWYDQRRFIDKYVISRFEFDNTQNLRWFFLDCNIDFRYVAK